MGTTMRIKLTIAYLGTPFCGWQKQPGKRTVQSELEHALFLLYGCKVCTTASGRTDAGVHALAQTVHFDAPAPHANERIAAALNRHLPPEIRAILAEEVTDDFNARKSAHKKTYEYRLYFAQNDNPFLKDRAARIYGDYNVPAMQQAAKKFVGTHDFTAFRLLGSNATTTVRTLYECELIFGANEFNAKSLTLTVSANGFLYKMVRLIVGSLFEVGKGRLSEAQIDKMLQSGEQLWNKKPAPPEGLYLKQVEY